MPKGFDTVPWKIRRIEFNRCTKPGDGLANVDKVQSNRVKLSGRVFAHHMVLVEQDIQASGACRQARYALAPPDDV